MEDPRMLWLTITNVALGVVVVVGLATVAFAILYEVVTRARKRARLFSELDGDLCRLLSVFGETAPEARVESRIGAISRHRRTSSSELV
jgi:hypothetical protein